MSEKIFLEMKKQREKLEDELQRLSSRIGEINDELARLEAAWNALMEGELYD